MKTANVPWPDDDKLLLRKCYEDHMHPCKEFARLMPQYSHDAVRKMASKMGLRRNPLGRVWSIHR